ncbi:phytanoyl-CoA dioxygenase family protein [Candidatus Tisiphia endosymbiont of Nemotelus uliginosus]|uniref:phytanoyl-CoA dioxygenase family protein n=1 Tax=Candidatus Tisiphia endosymbiont of Nemotelus uliginosus TaxID=3077926 RepID=UPI0035C8CDDA
MEVLQQKGFLIIKNMIPVELVVQSLSNIKNKVSELSQELDVSIFDYLNCTGRWGISSQITKTVPQILNKIIQNYLETLLQCQILAKKANVICKTADLIDAVPFHQDISYSFNDPYHFSVWLALNNVSSTSGALQIIKDSHNWVIEPLVDFWQPYFIDKYANWRHDKIEILPITAGDAIIFDAKLWHGSGKNLAAKDRFAYVTRWVIPNQSFPCIPKPQAANFGMFNCGVLTESILKEYLLSFNRQPNIEQQNMTELIKTWLTFLTDTSIHEINTIKAKNDLQQLFILHQASTLHDAGDISGKIYKNLWFSLLTFLNKKVQLVKLEL